MLDNISFNIYISSNCISRNFVSSNQLKNVLPRTLGWKKNNNFCKFKAVFTIGVSLEGALYSGFITNPQDIAPNFAGRLNWGKKSLFLFFDRAFIILFNPTLVYLHNTHSTWKGTVWIILNDPPCKDANVLFKMVCGLSTKVTSAFLQQETYTNN